MSEQGWNAEKVKRMKIHASYIGVGVFIIFVYIATKQWSSIANLVDKVNFAASITSVLLAILAIVYAVWSNYASSTTVATLTAAAEKVDKSAASISSASMELSSISATIRSDIKELSEKTSSLDSELKIHNNKIDQFMQTPAILDNKGTTQLVVSKHDADVFLRATSLMGVISIAVACKSAEKKAEFFIDEALKDTKYDESYIHGFLVAAESAGYFDNITLSLKDERRSISVDESKSFTFDGAISEIKQSIQRKMETAVEGSDDEIYVRVAKNYIKAIEKNFTELGLM